MSQIAKKQKDDGNSTPIPMFRFNTWIVALYVISGLSLLAGSGYVEVISEPRVNNPVYGFLPHVIYQFLFVVAIGVIYYLLTQKARKGSLSAELVSVGLLCFFVYNALYLTFFGFHKGAFIRPLFFAPLFVLSLLDLYDYFSIRKLVDISKRFPDGKDRLVPAVFFLLLVPLIYSSSVLEYYLMGVDERSQFVIKSPLFYFSDFDKTTWLIGRFFEVSSSLPHEMDILIVIPLCIIAAILLLKRKPLAYILTPVLLVMMSIRFLYIGKAFTLLIEVIAQLRNYDMVTWNWSRIIDETLKSIVFYNNSWFIKLVLSFLALVVLWIFLKGIKKDTPLVSEAEWGKRADKHSGKVEKSALLPEEGRFATKKNTA